MRRPLAVGAVLLALAGASLYAIAHFTGARVGHSEVSSQSRKGVGRYVPTAVEWATLKIEPVAERAFRAEHVTEGKVAVDEDRSTPVFSPYAGRVTKLSARPGESVRQGQPLFVIEAADTVQAQNDFIAAMTALNKAKSALDLAQIQEKRAKDLFEGKAVPLKDFSKPRRPHPSPERYAFVDRRRWMPRRTSCAFLALPMRRSWHFRTRAASIPRSPIYSPISGTVVQRKIGPGQYVNSGASDPVFVIGDLSTVWLVAFVRESDAASVSVGQEIAFNVMALPHRPLTARINYVSAAIDPQPGGSSFAPPSTTRTVCSSRKCLPMSRSIRQAITRR